MISSRRRHEPFLYIALFPLLALASLRVSADTRITREYRLRNADAANIIQVVNFSIVDPTGMRIMGGQGKRLVITGDAENQDAIAQLLPIIDQPTTETEPRRIQMQMLVWASGYLQQIKKPTAVAASPSTESSSHSRSSDVKRSTEVYKSVYSDEESRLGKTNRVILDEPVLPSLTSLTLKGIFKVSSSSPIALFSFDGRNFTARDGGLFERNRNRVAGVETEVRKDTVIVTGPDHKSREIRFVSPK